MNGNRSKWALGVRGIQFSAEAPLFGVPRTVLGTTDENGERKLEDITGRIATAARYSAMTPLQCAAVGISRMVQSAVWLGQEFERASSVYEKTGKLPRIDGQLPGFNINDLPRGAKTHVKMLLDSYRANILEDAPHRAKSKKGDEMFRFGNQGIDEITFVMGWLQRMGPRTEDDRTGDINSERVTFHLLDVLPEVRLSR